MQLHLDEQLSTLRLGGVKQALSQQQTQSALYQDMSFEERLQLLLSHELVQRYLFTRTGLTASVLPGWDNLSSRCTP